MGIFEAIGDLMDFGLNVKAERRSAKLAREQFNWQQKLAQEQVQMRVADAKKAGIHPLAALGVMPSSFSPVSMGGGFSGGDLGSVGQNIDRAVGAYASRRERDKQAAVAAMEAARTRKQEDILFDQRVRANEIDIAIGASRLRDINSPGTPPPLNNVGPGVVAVNPARTTSPSVTTEGREAGAIRDYGFTSTDSGGLAIVPSYDVHERIEDNLPQQLGWALRNQVVPFFSGLQPPDPREHPLPQGFRWEWDWTSQQFVPVGRRRLRPRRRN